ncbi:restriction endonuclease subunit S [uncultured Dokdonia sp.]|uniref:restriction endonuclease subunit S n=1 Tax=uncultured Dokdonia sp. TaxID=575653 RepID=UPI00260275D2|nr:restriction endonuclease subunit S [uncultured Dokdonia sp.]
MTAQNNKKNVIASANSESVIASEERAKQSLTSEHKSQKPSHDATANNKQIASKSSLRGTKQTTTKKSLSLKPKLRFKEFDEEWIIAKVIDFAPLQRGFDLPVIEIKEGKYPVVFSNGILKTHNEFKAYSPGVVTGRSGTIGKVTYVENDYWPHNTALWVTDFKGNDPKYVYYFYSNFKLERLGTGSGVPTLNRNDVHAQRRCIPKLPEQQKIANFLTAVDTKIQQLNTKKELLEQYKKGVMQQLFSQVLRFKDDDGNDFPDWKEVKGNMLFKSVSDKNHSSDLPILAITQDQGAIPREMINYKMIVTEKSVASYKVVQVGDFIISLRSFQGGIEYSNYKGICSPAYNILRPVSEEINKDFYKRYLKTDKYIRQLQSKLEGIRDGKMISFKYFSEIKLPFPSLKEQQKIATYLSAIDTKIESVATQISKTETFKKGLLQQLFV